eukprot:CAMPEP_0116955844 /NCGR_PEP_ID=MMETSP0467-20121206/42909_1 /TAXON_ID=283647 /ORGANISM="Mesodinium pulex, Strain SPMC105" /LENGTH=43 /DNA_ID= /DNA_START= /DNA_END= /DNA_ORIENTATION=
MSRTLAVGVALGAAGALGSAFVGPAAPNAAPALRATAAQAPAA